MKYAVPFIFLFILSCKTSTVVDPILLSPSCKIIQDRFDKWSSKNLPATDYYSYDSRGVLAEYRRVFDDQSKSTTTYANAFNQDQQLIKTEVKKDGEISRIALYTYWENKKLKSRKEVSTTLELYYEFDQAGNEKFFTSKAISNDSQIEKIYNANGKIVTQRNFSNGNLTSIRNWEYDTENRISKILNFNAINLTESKTEYIYNANNQLDKILVSDGSFTEYFYKDGLLSLIKSTNRQGRVNSAQKYEYLNSPLKYNVLNSTDGNFYYYAIQTEKYQNGKSKSVITYNTNIKRTENINEAVRTSEENFDEKGNRINYLQFDINNNAFHIQKSVYSCN